jgi:hypothetical protein
MPIASLPEKQANSAASRVQRYRAVRGLHESPGQRSRWMIWMLCDDFASHPRDVVGLRWHRSSDP